MSGDYIDYTYLQKKGLIKTKQPEASPVKYDKDGYIQLNQSTSSSAVSTPTETPASNPMGGFFDNSSTSLPSTTSSSGGFGSFFDSNSSPTPSSPVYGSDSSSDVGLLKSRIESIEYKIDNLLRKMEELELRRGSS